MKKIFKIASASFFIIVIVIVILLLTSPKPTAFLIYKLFEGGVAVKPENYELIVNNTVSYEDISYHSAYKSGELDIIMPKHVTHELPVIIWVHGGAYLGGDKSDVTEYAVQIANEGYVVVNMNYDLAPSSVYPTPLIQVGEAYNYIAENATAYKIDINKIYFAGDSAGAQIAGQFVNIQVDEQYAALINMDQIVPSESIMGVLLFCGPYDVAKFSQMSENIFMRFIYKQIGWAYIGERNWESTEAVKYASLIDHVSANFPSTFITDANANSFEDQGKAFVESLRSKDVYVDDVFYSIEEVKLKHEYQFMMNLPEAENTFRRLVEFLHMTSSGYSY